MNMINESACVALRKLLEDGNRELEVSILGRRWVDTYGNTYHMVYIDVLFPKMSSYTSLIATGIPNYGYGDMWEQTAFNMWFEATAYGTDVNHELSAKVAQSNFNTCYLSGLLKALKIKVDYNVVDVKRKKDL